MFYKLTKCSLLFYFQTRYFVLLCTVLHPGFYNPLTHCGRVTHICVGNLIIIGSDNGLSPGRRQAIIWTNAGILLIGPSGTNFGEILIGIETFQFKKMHLKMSSVKWRPFVSASMCHQPVQQSSKQWRGSFHRTQRADDTLTFSWGVSYTLVLPMYL